MREYPSGIDSGLELSLPDPLDEAPVDENGRTAVPGLPEIYVISNVTGADGLPVGSFGAGEAAWHTDTSYLDVPPDASGLYAVEIPPRGATC